MSKKNLFHSDHFRLLAIQRLPGFGSDHIPLMTTLLLDDQRGAL